MKKIIAVLLSVLMLFSVMTVMASAFSCTCTDVPHEEGKSCHCCAACPNLDLSYLSSCAIDQSTDGSFDGSVCCADCKGVLPCYCGCACCTDDGQTNDDIKDTDNTLDKIWDEEDQSNFVRSFQKILKQISDFFDDLFETIFEFLRIEDVLGPKE